MAQQEAANEVMQLKFRTNPNNTVALISMGGAWPQMLVPLYRQRVTLQRQLYAMKPCGEVDPLTTLRIAKLVFKHSQGPRLTQRVMLFICSPVQHIKVAEHIHTVGEAMYRAHILLDIILLGTVEELARTYALFQPLAARLGDKCQIMTVTGERSLTYAIMGQLESLIGVIRELEPAAVGNEGSEDPELMLAIQMSLQDMQKQNKQRPPQARAEPKRTHRSNSASSSSLSVLKNTEMKLRKIRSSDQYKHLKTKAFKEREYTMPNSL